jgi:hypothetical protein
MSAEDHSFHRHDVHRPHDASPDAIAGNPVPCSSAGKIAAAADALAARAATQAPPDLRRRQVFHRVDAAEIR